MLILAIDTSTRAGSIALLRDRQVLAEIAAHEETPYSTRLFRDLELLQSRSQFRMAQVDLFAVAAGTPGNTSTASASAFSMTMDAIVLASPTRDLRIDLLRGLAVIAMIVDHVAS